MKEEQKIDGKFGVRIKYITNVRIPTGRAHGYAIMKMCSEFAKAGVDVEMFVPSKGNNENKKDPFEFYGLERNFKINKVKSFDLLGRTLKFGRLFYWLDIVSFLLALKFKLRFDSGDIIYTRDFLISLFLPKAALVVLELHHIPLNLFLFSRALKNVALLVVLNSYLKEDLIKLGVSPTKIFVSPSGVDLQDFVPNKAQDEAKKQLNLSQYKKIVLYIGQFYPWKGVDTLADSARLLPDKSFIFAGGVEPELSKFIGKYAQTENIIITSFVNRSLVSMYMASADVLVIPNSAKEKISSHYTSPMKLFEYMAAKKPIIASDLPSIREILTENECVFAEPDNPESFAKAIEKVLNDEDLALRIATNAFNKVGEYAWDKKAKNILNQISS